MYDLPSEFPEEPGLPDEYHDLQPQLLSRTLRLAAYSREDWFTASDLNVYYDVQHPLWHKRPDWFLAVNVPRLYDGIDLRRSYVVWQEGRAPEVVVELLSPGTERGDLGRFYEGAETPDNASSSGAMQQTEDMSQGDNVPEKFTVYERYLRVPYYIVFNRYSGTLRFFQMVGDSYQEQPVQQEGNLKIWLPGLEVGLGLWQGEFEGIPRQWLRWCDQNGDWLLLDTEQAQLAKEQERLAKEQMQNQLLQAARNLLAQGMAMDDVVRTLALTDEQIAQLNSP